MRCPGCGTEAIDGKRFCHACGTELERKCPNCGASVDAAWRFCPDCGFRLSDDAAPAVRNDAPAVPPPAEERLGRLARHIPQTLVNKILAARGSISGERKLVTVLFCDLAGSTAIAEGLDPEEYHELLEEYLEIAFHEIYRFEGIVNQLAGDGMMALFGAPVAHEDAPHRAVGAALAIREALARFNEEARRRDRPELSARIGIHTGPVVVGTVGNDLKMDYSAIGDTTNLAARLQSLADPGTILVSDATWRLIHGFFRVEPTGPLAVKGKSDPVDAYLVLGATESATAITVAAARGLTPFVGRDVELEQLFRGFEQLAGSLPQVVSIVGDAGSGKSRLLYEFRKRIGGRPATIFEARCSSITQSLPYAPWIGMLRQYFELRSGDDVGCCCDRIATRLDELALAREEVYPYLCRVLSLPGNGLEERPAEEIREETFKAIAHLVVAVSARAPVVLVIEDLHWIDDPSREMLELAVSELHHAPVMIVATHRPDYQPTWRARVPLTQLLLRRLGDGEVRSIVRSLAGGPLPAPLEALVLRKAEGNPFFAEEMTRTLVDEGYLIRGEREVRLTRPIEQIRVPDTIHELIGARLDRLRPGAKRVVQVASVLGRQFHRGDLARLLAGEDVDVSAELRELELAGIVHRKNVLSDDELRFGESLTQEVAYEGLLLRERRRLHDRVADLLETEPGDRTADRSALLAHHRTRGDSRSRAVAALLRAAEDAEKIPSYGTAARFYREAWDIAETALAGVDGASADLRGLAVEAAVGLCRMGVIYGTIEVSVSERAAPRAIEIARTLGRIDQVAGLSVYRGMALASAEREKFGQGISLIEEGLRLGEQEKDTATMIGGARALGWVYALDGRFADAGERLDAVLATLERKGDHVRRTDTWFGTTYLRIAQRFFRDEIESVEDWARQTYDLAVEASNRTVQAGMQGWLAWGAFVRGNYDETRDCAARSLEIAERIGNIAAMRMAAALRLGAAVELGEVDGVSSWIDRIEQGHQVRSDMALKSPLVVEVLLARGEQERAQRFAEVAWEFAGGRLREAFCALALGEAYRAAGPVRHEEAARWYGRAEVLAREIGLGSALARAELGHASLLGEAGDRRQATRIALAAKERFETLGFSRYREQAERLLRRLTDAA